MAAAVEIENVPVAERLRRRDADGATPRSSSQNLRALRRRWHKRPSTAVCARMASTVVSKRHCA